MGNYIAFTYSFYSSTVVSAKATDTFGSLLRRSQELSGETEESDHIELEPGGFSRSAFVNL